MKSGLKESNIVHLIRRRFVALTAAMKSGLKDDADVLDSEADVLVALTAAMKSGLKGINVPIKSVASCSVALTAAMKSGLKGLHIDKLMPHRLLHSLPR